MNLRLNSLAAMVDNDVRVADIGTDHAYLPIELIKSGKISYAIASDIAKGPLDNAKKDVQEAGLADQIDTRLGAGLSTVSEQDQIDTVIIAGMGGKLITQILNDAWQNKLQFKTLILEPNVGECGVRKWLTEHSYEIKAEQIVAEAGHTYELIKAVKSQIKSNLSAAELYFGPFLLREKNDIFKQKWLGQLKYHRSLLTNLNKAKNNDLVHIKQVEHEIKMIEGVLND